MFEILPVDETIRELLGERPSSDRIHRAAVEKGMTTLLQSGVGMAKRGETSLDEVLRMLPPEQQRSA